MTLKETLSFTLNRFRTLSIKHPIGIVYNKGIMTLYQLNIKFNISTLFESTYMPRNGRHKALILPINLNSLLDAQLYLTNSKDSVIIAPREWGFDIMEPNKDGDPLIIHEVRFYSIKNKYILWAMKWMPQFSALLKNMK